MITYIDRISKKLEEEPVYGGAFITFLYGSSFISRYLGRPLSYLLGECPISSRFYGWMQKRRRSQKKILPFIEKFRIDTKEFALPPTAFTSFNDFFTRHLKAEARPLAPGKNIAIIPADGRYLFYQDISQADGFLVKGKKFTLEALLQDSSLAKQYRKGSMAIARLCPTDYHRYHFPCDTISFTSRQIDGPLYSVNPLATRNRLSIFSDNKRSVSILNTESFGQVLFIEVGATCVGTIHTTHKEDIPAKKGDEKGYFSFGGSSLILLFQPGTIQFDADLLAATAQTTADGVQREIRCLMGQRMGESTLS